jgi:hypothetical protein
MLQSFKYHPSFFLAYLVRGSELTTFREECSVARLHILHQIRHFCFLTEFVVVVMGTKQITILIAWRMLGTSRRLSYTTTHHNLF